MRTYANRLSFFGQFLGVILPVLHFVGTLDHLFFKDLEWTIGFNENY